MGVGCAWLMDDNMEVLIMTAVAAVVGLIFGIFAYRNDIPPRMFWAKSFNDIFRFSFTAILGYAFNIAISSLRVFCYANNRRDCISKM